MNVPADTAPVSKSCEKDAAFEFLMMSRDGVSPKSICHHDAREKKKKKKKEETGNRSLIRNALLHTCLAGAHLKKKLEKALSVLSLSSSNQFLILFGQKRLNFRGLYEVSKSSNDAKKIFGVGPSVLRSEMVTAFYKYSCGEKQFKSLCVREFTKTTDGVNLKPKCWRHR